MKVTKELLKELYSEYNAKYFGGELGRCDFSFFPKNIICLGSYQKKEDAKGRIKDKIWIGSFVKWNETLLQQVLLHEMIHVYNTRIEKCRWYGILGHGRCFKRHVKRLRKDYGISLTRQKSFTDVNGKKISPKMWERILLFLIDW
jgi:hypothetical protein